MGEVDEGDGVESPNEDVNEGEGRREGRMDKEWMKNG